MIQIEFNKRDIEDLYTILGELSDRLATEKEFGDYCGYIPYRTFMNKIGRLIRKLREAETTRGKRNV